MYDLIVVGAGPAGSTCARSAALQGLRVLLLDKEVHPRPRPCGGILSKRVQNLLDMDMTSVIERSINSVVIHPPSGDPILCHRVDVAGMSVRRDKFDLLLLRGARDAGAEVVDGIRVVQVENISNGIRVLCTGDSYRGHLLVGADGISSIVARNMGIRHRWSSNSVYQCVTADVSLQNSEIERFMSYEGVESPAFEMHLGPVHFGHGWILPRRDEVNVGLRCRKDYADDLYSNWCTFLERFKSKWGLRLNADDARTARVPTVPSGAHFTARRTMLVGDAAGLVSALTGEGVYYAIVSGRLAAEVAVESVRTRNASHVRVYDDLLAQHLLGELRMSQKSAEMIFRTGKTLMTFCQVAREDNLIRELIADLVLGDRSYSKALTEMARRMLIRHPLETLRMSHV